MVEKNEIQAQALTSVLLLQDDSMILGFSSPFLGLGFSICITRVLEDRTVRSSDSKNLRWYGSSRY
jgi:hypothetical protein